MITEYVRAYRDLSRMLARACPPWAWVLAFADACASLRASIPVE
jgi:hypothetical protein